MSTTTRAFSGAKLRERRNKLKIKQIALAQQAGIARSYLCEIEKGLKRPSVDTLQALSAALKTRMDTFFA
jgi:transcriptional regulator with XRE-family HTH domain